MRKWQKPMLRSSRSSIAWENEGNTDGEEHSHATVNLSRFVGACLDDRTLLIAIASKSNLRAKSMR